MKLSRKLLIRIIAILILSGGMIGVFGIWMTYSNTQTLMYDQVETEVKLRSALIEEKLNSTIRLVEMYKENPLVIQALKDQRTNKALKDSFTATVNSNNDLISLISIADRQGSVLIADSINNSEGVDLSERPYLMEAVESKETSTSEVIISKSDGSPVIAIASPIYENNTYLGSVVATVKFELVTDLIDDVVIGEKGYAYLVDLQGLDAGTIIDHPNPDMIMTTNLYDLKNKDLSNLVNNMKKNSSGDGTYVHDGEEKYVRYENLGNYALAVTVNTSDVNSAATKIRNMTILILFGSIVFSTLIGQIVIRRAVIKPISKLQKSMAMAGVGDLTHEVSIKTKDEIETLANDYNKMLFNQKEILRGVAQVSEDLSSSAEELTASAEEVNGSSEEVSNRVNKMMENVMDEQVAVDGVNDHMNALKEGMNQTFKMSETSKVACDDALVVAESGREGVQNSIASIGEISKSTQSVLGAFDVLNEKAKEVTGISEIIGSIAEQINLLALNASIEAARAGDAGRGFSVVAEEVRKLAEQTSTESENIFNVLDHITKLIKEADGYVKHTKVRVDEGEASVVSLDGRFVTLMEAFTGLNKALDTLKTTSQGQLEGAESITNSVASVKSVTHENTSMAQEISAACEEQVAVTESLSQASEESSAMAEQLRELLSKFKL